MAIDISGLAGAFGISPGTALILLFLVAITIYYVSISIKNKETRTKFVTISVLGVIMLIALSGGFLKPSEKSISFSEADLDVEYDRQLWQDDYQFVAEQKLTGYDSLTSNTEYYDYDNDLITAVAGKIAAESESAEEAVAKTLEFVYANIGYIKGESDNNCFYGTAPEILASGSGQCDTQSITVISILRKMGIAAQPVGGCIVQNPSCKLQALFQSVTGFKEPQFTELSDIRLDTEQESFSRGEDISREETVFGRSGGLHAYVMAWLPEQEWTTLEPTAGKFADTKCWYYHVELFPGNNQKEDICVSKNEDYAKACQIGSLEFLDINGIGLATEVSP